MQLFGRGPLLASARGLLPGIDARPSAYNETPEDEDGLLDFLWSVLLGKFQEEQSTGQIATGALVATLVGLVPTSGSAAADPRGRVCAG